jgi:hypothetical protein
MKTDRTADRTSTLDITHEEENMTTQPSIDTMARTLATPQSRRGLLKLLGAATLSAGLGLTGHTATAKRRKKGRKGKKGAGSGSTGSRSGSQSQQPPRQMCQVGQWMGGGAVPNNGDVFTTPVLARGQRYRLVVSDSVLTGFYFGSPHAIDASHAFDVTYEQYGYRSWNGEYVGLSIDGRQPNWGSYERSHVYEKIVTGEGRALELRFIDWNEMFYGYADNEGTLKVDIFCA